MIFGTEVLSLDGEKGEEKAERPAKNYKKSLQRLKPEKVTDAPIHETIIALNRHHYFPYPQAEPRGKCYNMSYFVAGKSY